MAKSIFTREEYDSLIDAFAQKIWLLHERCAALEELRKQFNAYPVVYREFGTFFYLAYCSFFNELYHGVYQLVDESNDTMSFIKLLKIDPKNKPRAASRDKQEAEFAKTEEELTKELEKNTNVKKIKSYRSKILAHQNGELLLNLEAAKKFYEEMKIQLEEIVVLLEFMGKALQKAAMRGTFIPLTLPNTPIRLQIRDLFAALAQNQTVST